jgi:chromosomal replication initiation ATPase DnaA
VPRALAAAVVGAVAGLYEMHEATLTGTRKPADQVEARRIACQILYEQGYGESAIGRVIGRDHSTVVHSLRRLERHMSPQEWDCLQTARRLVRARLAQQGWAAQPQGAQQ